MGLTITSIKRPVVVLMAMLAIFLMGFIAYRSTRLELNPDVSFGVITVTTVYPGAGPDEINNLVTRRIEDSVSGISGVQQITGTSQDGVSIVVIQLEIGTSVPETIDDVRTQLDLIKRDLPTDAEDPVVGKVDTGTDPVLTLVAKSDRLSPVEMRSIIDNELKDEFSRVPGVGSVGVAGGDIREIQVRLRIEDMMRYGVGVLDIQRALQSASLNVPSGRMTNGEREFNVRVLGEADTVEDIANLSVRLSDPSNPNAISNQVKLGDVATVSDTVAERRTNFRLDGQEAVAVTILKAKEGTAVEISKAIRQPLPGKKVSMLDEIEAKYGIEFLPTLDVSRQIEESLFDLQFALAFGIVLVMLVTYMFLHDWRGTLIVSIAIPICIFAALIMVKLFGFTLNTLTLVALSLAVGVLVDDAIVVIENTYRHLQMGESPYDAAVNGRNEIGTAAIAITMADVVVFLPIAFMGGIVGQFYRPLALTYATCVLVSLIVSFTVTPMLAARWFKEGEDPEHPKTTFARGFNRFFHGFADRYANVLKWSLDHRWTVFGGGFAALFATFAFIGGSTVLVPEDPGKHWMEAVQRGMGLAQPTIILGLLIFIGNLIRNAVRKAKGDEPYRGTWGILGKTLLFAAIFPIAAGAGYGYRYYYKGGDDVFKFAFLPPSDVGRINIDIEMATDASLERTSEAVRQVEQRLMGHPDIHYVYTTLGSTASGGFGAGSQAPNVARTQVVLWEKSALLDKLPWAKHEEPLRDTPDTTVAAQLLERIGQVPGATVKVAVSSGFDFGAAIQLSFQSDEREEALSTAIKVRDLLASGQIKGVVQPDISSKPGKPELRVIPDPARQGLEGISTQQLGGALRTLYEGNEDVKFRENGLEYDVRVMMDQVERSDPSLLGQVPVTFVRGNPIFVSEISEIEVGESVTKIDRVDRKPEVRVTANLLPGYAAGSVQAEIDRLIKEGNLVPENVTYKPLGQADAQQRETGYLFGAIFFGVILVYFVLAALYNNLLYPFVIQLAQPQAMVGALLALMLTNTTLNIIAMIGIVAMIGLVGKNAILLVDYTNTLRDRGLPRYDALVESGRTRLRPIMMTTIALLVGLMPVALAIGRGSEFRETIGITIIGGTLLSTFLTLLVIPCSYSIFDDLYKVFGRMRKPAEAVESGTSPAEPS